MPTSSQALISFCIDQSETHEPRPHPGSAVCSHRHPAPCTVAGVYNLSGCVPLNIKSVNAYQASNVLGRESAQLFKYHKLPKGYTSILAFDENDQAFHWQALGGVDDSSLRSRCSYCESQDQQPNDPDVTGQPNTRSRPYSATPTTSRTKERAESSVKFVDAVLYEKLVTLGFRPSGLALKDGSRPKIPSRRVVSVPDANVRRKSSSAKVPDTSTKSSTTTIDIRDTPTTQCISFDSGSQEDESLIPHPPDQFSDDDDDEEDPTYEEYNRVRPSIHMRKEPPDSRPLTVIFSFRDNETSSHAEVKYLMETQIGVKVTAVQFDPLDIRADKPGIRSRWTVDLYSKDDLNKVLKQCLVIGRDKILMYRYDEIARREVSSFKYYSTVKNAQKKLGLSKSLKKVHAAVKVTSTLRKAVSDRGRLGR